VAMAMGGFTSFASPFLTSRMVQAPGWTKFGVDLVVGSYGGFGELAAKSIFDEPRSPFARMSFGEGVDSLLALQVDSLSTMETATEIDEWSPPSLSFSPPSPTSLLLGGDVNLGPVGGESGDGGDSGDRDEADDDDGGF